MTVHGRGSPSDEFFVGYLSPTPPAHRRASLIAASLFALLGLTVAALSTTLRRDPGPGVWSDVPSAYTGLLTADPYPMLHAGPDEPPAILVAPGKHGPALGADLIGGPVTLTGTLLRRGDLRVIEVESAAAAESPATDIAPLTLGETRTLRGTIIDPKCYAGAMKPGDGKSHRACAVRCIAGGIPPVLAVPETGGGESYYLLAAADGSRLNDAILPFVGDAVEVTGREARRGRARLLLVDPARLRRL